MRHDAVPARRDFLGRLAAAGVAAAAWTRGAPLAAQPASPRAATAQSAYDDTWTRRVAAAKHRAVFDAPEAADGLALMQARIYRDGYRQALGAPAADVAPVIVLRHNATVLAFDDALWAKYPVGRVRNVRDPATGQHPSRNPWSRPHSEAERRGGDFLEALIASGVTVLACELAARRTAGMIAREAGGDPDAVMAEIRAGLVPGVLLQPSGIYATARAQEVGCVFMRST